MKTLNQNQLKQYRHILHQAESYVRNFDELSSTERLRIFKARTHLNLLKQEWCIQLTNRLFYGLSPQTSVVQQLLKMGVTNTDVEFKSKATIAELRIPKKIVVKRLVECGVLTEDFYKLK